MIVSIERKDDGSGESCAGRSLHNDRNKNKGIAFVVRGVWFFYNYVMFVLSKGELCRGKRCACAIYRRLEV